jgi:hypothetical protein
VDTYAAVCATLADILQSSTQGPARLQQQQQQYGHTQIHAAHSPPLIVWLLCMWEALVMCWFVPDTAASALTASPCMAAAAAAFVSLAAAVLRSPRMDSTSRTFAVDKSVSLFRCIDEEMEAVATARSAAKQQMLTSKLDAAVGGQLLQSRDYLSLLAACHAVCAQQVHSRTRAKASAFPAASQDTAAAAAAATGGSAAAPAASNKLLRELGIAEPLLAPHMHDDDDVVLLMHGSCTALQHVVQCMLRNAGHVSSAAPSSSSGAPSYSTAAVAGVLSSAVVEAWLLTLVELVLLLRPRYKGAPVNAAGVVLQAARSLKMTRAVGPDSMLALDACKSRLFKPLLHQLLPDVWGALRSGKIWGAADADRWQPMLEQGLRCVLVETLADGEHMTV